MNFKEVLLESTSNRQVPENRISVIHGKNKYITINRKVSELISERGFDHVKVFEDVESQTVSFVFSNTGLLIQPVTDQSKVVRIQHKPLIEYLVRFFSLPPMNDKDFLYISGNKSNKTDQLTFFIRKEKSFEVEL